MNQTLLILDNLTETHEHLQEYRKIISLILEHKTKNPDICVENCKALFEGIAHVILKGLKSDYSKKIYDDKSVQRLVGDMFIALKAYTTVEDHYYIPNFVNAIGTIRNERGDVSHGKAYPKEITSDTIFVEMVVGITDTFIAYILKIFVSINIQKSDIFKYEDYEDFNNWLDEQDTAGFLKRYSQALYEIDPVRYETELKNYYPDKDF